MLDFLKFMIVLIFAILGTVLLLSEMAEFELLVFIFIKIFGSAAMLVAILLGKYFFPKYDGDES
jgi:hypothetical protein